jgi:hypothetical protein
VKTVLLASGQGGGNRVPVRNGLIAEYNFTENKNLMKYSEQLDYSAWTKNGCTVTADYGVAPDGTLTADRIVSTTHDQQVMQTSMPVTPNTNYVYSWYMKNNGGTASGSWGIYDSTNSSFLPDAGQMAAITIPNDWTRFQISFTTGRTTAAITVYALYSAFIGGNDLLFWGSQLEVIPQRNLLLDSERFQNSSWITSSSSVVSNQTAAPDGAATADKLLIDATPGASHYLSQVFIPCIVGQTYTASFYAKRGSFDWIYWEGYVSGYCPSVYFNILNGAVGATANCTATITDVGSGWWRCTATFTPTAAMNYFTIALAEGNNDMIIDGDSVSFSYIWGAQLELGSGVTAYQSQPRTDANATPYIKTGDKQLLMDSSKARKNLLLPNQANCCENNVIALAGWQNINQCVLTSEPTGTTPSWQGSYCIKAVSSGSGYRRCGTEVYKTPCKPLTTYTISVYLKGTGTVGGGIDLCEFTDTGAYITSTASASISLNVNWTRYSVTATTSSTTRNIAIGMGMYADVTFYIDGAQIEEGSTLTDWEAPPNIGMLGSSFGVDTNDPKWNGGGAGFVTDDYVTLPRILFTSGYTVILVANILAADGTYPTLFSNQSAISGTGSGFGFARINTGTTCNMYHADGAGNIQAVGKTFSGVGWKMLSLLHDGSYVYLIDNKAKSSGLAAVGLTTPAQVSIIGKMPVNNNYFNSTIAYVLLYNRALTNGEIAVVYKFLKSYLLKNRRIALP